MSKIQIKNFSNRDAGYFSMLFNNTTVYFGFAYPDVVKYHTGDNLDVYLEHLALLAISESHNKATLDKNSYFDFCCGRFEFTNYIPDWAKDIYVE